LGGGRRRRTERDKGESLKAPESYCNFKYLRETDKTGRSWKKDLVIITNKGRGVKLRNSYRTGKKAGKDTLERKKLYLNIARIKY